MRKHRLWSLAVAATMVLAACTGSPPATPQPPQATPTPDAAPTPAATPTQGTSPTEAPTEEPTAFDWRQFDGTEIRVLANQFAWQVALEPLIPEFEELTGISVVFETLPEAQFRQRLQVELTAGSTDIDVFLSALFQDGARFVRAGWYEDLSAYPQDSSITSPDYGFENFGQGLIDGHTLDGVLIGIPILTDVEMLYYRKDIFEQANVQVPTTFQEFEAVLPVLDNPDEGIRAWGSRGKGAAAVTQMSIFLYNHGGHWTNDEGYAGFDTPEGLAAFDFYGRNLREHGPLGVTGFSWEELMPLFQQRQLAMWNDSSAFLGQVINPENSVDVDNIGFARMPAGPGGEYNSFFPWALSMSSLSSNKEAGWYFIQWASSQEMVERLQAEGVAGARTDTVFPDTVPAEWVEVFQYNLEIARPKLPVVVPVPEVRDAIGAAIVATIQGTDVQAALTQAAQEFNRAVDAAR